MLGIFLDLETTGLDPKKHRILEIAFKILDLSTGKTLHTFQSIVKQPLSVWQKSDPTSLKINGFSWDMLSCGKKEEDLTKEIIEIFQQQRICRKKSVYICQNPSFDRAFFSQIIEIYQQEALQWPYHWLDLASMYWALTLKKNFSSPPSFPSSLSKNAIAKKNNLPLEKDPHRAINGVDHLLLCYKKIVGIPNTRQTS